MIDYSGLTPRDLFYTQKEAFMKGDMAAVKEMAAIAKSRMKPKGDWEEAKKELDNMALPPQDSLNWKELKEYASHQEKKQKHELKTFIQYLNILGYSGEARISRCDECAKVRNASLRLFNNDKNECHEKWFVYHGKNVEGKDVFDFDAS